MYSYDRDVRPSERPPFSFQVPKEVGRVGTESSSFVEPITSRKDGIQALFTKQRQKSLHPTSSPTTPKAKRKLEDNSTPSGLPAESSGTVDTNPRVFVGPSPSKRSKKLTGDESNQPVSISFSFRLAPWFIMYQQALTEVVVKAKSGSSPRKGKIAKVGTIVPP